MKGLNVMDDGKNGMVEKYYDRHGDALDTDKINPIKMMHHWKEILIDETSTKSVMIFRKDVFGDICMETVTRMHGKIQTYVSEEEITQKTVDEILLLCNQRGYEIHITLDI
jgi:hypothetical protein